MNIEPAAYEFVVIGGGLFLASIVPLIMGYYLIKRRKSNKYDVDLLNKKERATPNIANNSYKTFISNDFPWFIGKELLEYENVNAENLDELTAKVNSKLVQGYILTSPVIYFEARDIFCQPMGKIDR
jgi:hypothetical protein